MLRTSDGNLAAYREVVSFAQLAEIPLVLLHMQRLDAGLSPIPLLGDVDIVLARHIGFGSLPLPVFAATDLSSARALVGRAIEIAETLHTPVIVLLSANVSAGEALPNRTATVRERPTPAPAMPLPDGLPLERRGKGRSSDQGEATSPTLDAAAKAGCVSFAGQVNGRRVVLNLSEDELAPHLQRLRNKVLNAGEMLEHTVADPDPEAETLLISYGHVDHAARRAVRLVRENNARVSHLTIHSLWPLPQRALKRAVTPFVRRVLLPELNMGLYAEELSKLLRSVKLESLTRYDGRPIDPETIARRITNWPCG